MAVEKILTFPVNSEFKKIKTWSEIKKSHPKKWVLMYLEATEKATLKKTIETVVKIILEKPKDDPIAIFNQIKQTGTNVELWLEVFNDTRIYSIDEMCLGLAKNYSIDEILNFFSIFNIEKEQEKTLVLALVKNGFERNQIINTAKEKGVFKKDKIDVSLSLCEESKNINNIEIEIFTTIKNVLTKTIQNFDEEIKNIILQNNFEEKYKNNLFPEIKTITQNLSLKVAEEYGDENKNVVTLNLAELYFLLKNYY